MNLIGRALLFAGGTALTVMAAHSMPVHAQSTGQTTGQSAVSPPGATPANAQSAPQPKASKGPTGGKAASKSATETAEPARTDGGSQLRQRIDQLEEQVTEMHVAVGTLESLAKTGAGRASSATAPAGGMPGDAAARLDGLENRLRTLTSQIEQMGQQIRALETRGGRSSPDRTDAGPSAAPSSRAAEARPAEQSPAADRMTERGPDRGAERGAERGDGIGGLIRGPGSDRSADVGAASLPPIGSPSASPQARQQPASLTTSGNPRESYERAYGSLLRQDYAAAEIGFAEFLSQFPSHELSGNAQYWLGESFYVRGQYKPAANAFLKGYQAYPKSQKGPDSLLKLGMSLDKLGQRDAACSSIGELGTRFPTAPAHILSRAQSERARLGC